ncbi:hypothetical protein [Chryseobacterium daecheongense]|uniref:Uncharacterized protein n=1 Tax=Chryseobacterium daecheongense TaxID=192389 RepID=A0A3N0W312_9FLAO|nr:hypothetical protein [Chryseobacterium daecheongense]ROH99456.1 hypothetical protein EGI05_00745 [Chryseobacterium daecheongense]TDX95643.1 hypothetical protein BCF50_1426 [Chryseobacterium daecheongense]
MTQYQAKSPNSLSFDITKSDQLIGKLIYQGWFKFNAIIELSDNSTYQIEPKGFWGTTIELKDGENVLLKFNMNWNGEIIIQTFFDNAEKDYIFKHRGIFKDSYVLTDHEGAELLVMKPHLKWSVMNYEYTITASDNFETLPQKEILLISSLHCANYYMSMMTTFMGV